LHIAVFGDFCLDRYFEIDPSKRESSIETGLPVHNVSKVRVSPGGAGTIVNNLAALGLGHIYPVGFCGDDGEGYELRRALKQLPGVKLRGFIKTTQRRTFTYCKPLAVHSERAPEELSRLDIKNWTPTPALLQGLLISKLKEAAADANAVIVLDQVDVPETGVVTRKVLEALQELVKEDPHLLVLADSRRSLRDFPPLVFKMNAAELATLSGKKSDLSLEEIGQMAGELAVKNRRSVFVTLAEQGIIGTTGRGAYTHVPALPLRGPIDIVGAGDAVSANLAPAMVAEATLKEALMIANAAASVVIHKIGTTGTASVGEIEKLLLPEP
jgi:rfaE bifunctional protein kinase chain/domain